LTVFTLPFESEIDRVENINWDKLMFQFEDASIYQTWKYGIIRRGAGNVSHLVLKRSDEIVGCCQVTLNRLPFPLCSIAYAVWGPMWRKTGVEPDLEIFRNLIRQLKLEYGIRRCSLLRISPNVFESANGSVLKAIMESEGFTLSSEIAKYQTFRVDLSPPLDDLRKNLLQKWRNCLNKAEKNGLEIIEGTKAELYKIFLALANEMRERKKFISGVDYEEYGRIQNELPEPQKMRILVCSANGEPVCVSMYSAIGNTGIYLLGASSAKALGLNATYLLQWRMIQRLKESGLRWYDLGGIDPTNNPGVYAFKTGIAGKNGSPEQLLGEFRGCFTFRSRITYAILSAVKRLRRKN
jgi:lipid II:glycine glycyltransferase (peptidoglycan interpeptide bridge formation enzyme)